MNDLSLDLQIEPLETLEAPIWNANDYIALGIGLYNGALIVGCIAVGLT